MKIRDLPFNVSILDTTKLPIGKDRVVTSRDVYEGSSTSISGRELHPEGIYSIPIFGRIGSKERDTRYGLVDLKVALFHPFIYKTLVKLKGLYGGILEGRSYAKWDPNLKDFVQSDVLNGETGMAFFIKHWRDIEFKDTGSDLRTQRIKLIEKFKSISTTDKMIIIPAGYRDFTVNADGRAEENEINSFYRRQVGIADTLTRGADPNTIDTTRQAMQRVFNDLFDYLVNMFAGKNKFMQGKYAKRYIMNGTRNVLTAMHVTIDELGQGREITLNHTVVGLYQATKMILPISKYHVLNGLISTVFDTGSSTANLVDPKTLKLVRVDLESDVMDKWTSFDGIEKVINTLEIPGLRLRPIMVGNYALGLVYQDDKYFRVFSDINTLPEHLDIRNVRLLTYAEWLYDAMANKYEDYYAYLSRYPVTGDDSKYPSLPYVKTTIDDLILERLDDQWQPTGIKVQSYPNVNSPDFFDTMSPHFSKIKGLGADYDGDTGSLNAVYENRSIASARERLSKRVAYVNSSNQMRSSMNDLVTKLLFRNMTGDLE